MRRIKDLDWKKEIKVGLRVKSLASGRLGTIVRIDEDDDCYSWIQWDGEKEVYSGFNMNDCECKVVE